VLGLLACARGWPNALGANFDGKLETAQGTILQRQFTRQELKRMGEELAGARGSGRARKVVLAYSGGVDNQRLHPYLREEVGCRGGDQTFRPRSGPWAMSSNRSVSRPSKPAQANRWWGS